MARTFYTSSPAVAYISSLEKWVVYVCGRGTDEKEYIFALDEAGNGNGTTTEIWKRQIEGCEDSSPAVSEGIVYIIGGTAGDYFYALDAANGNTLWTKYVSQTIFWPAAAIYENKAIIASGTYNYGSFLHVFEKTEGNEIWKENFGDSWEYSNTEYFTTTGGLPPKPINPSPVDAVSDITLDETPLSWDAG